MDQERYRIEAADIVGMERCWEGGLASIRRLGGNVAEIRKKMAKAPKRVERTDNKKKFESTGGIEIEGVKERKKSTSSRAMERSGTEFYPLSRASAAKVR